MYQAKIGYTTVTWAVAGGAGWMERGMRDISALGFRAFETFSNTTIQRDVFARCSTSSICMWHAWI